MDFDFSRENGERIDDLMKRFENEADISEFLSTIDVGEKCASNLESCIENLNRKQLILEDAAVECFVDGIQPIGQLQSQIREADEILKEMEDSFSTFQNGLSGISTQIRDLHANSQEMNEKLKNRKATLEVLNVYVSQVIVTPALVERLTSEPVDAPRFVSQLALLVRKLEHASQPGIIERPSSAMSLPELQKLETTVIARIRDYLVEKINDFKVPKTNLQMLQRGVLAKQAALHLFLQERHPPTAAAIRQHYCQTVSRIYVSQFRAYVNSLGRLQLDGVPNRADGIGWFASPVSSPASTFQDSAKSIFGGFLGLPTQSRPSDAICCSVATPSISSLRGRHSILRFLGSDPIIPHAVIAQQTAAATAAAAPSPPDAPPPVPSKFFPEELFRSHQKLLMDTASSEFFFVSEFFDCSSSDRVTILPELRPAAIFLEIFQRTLQYFLEIGEASIANSSDLVGLLLMARINEFSRMTLLRRRVPCVDQYIDRLQAMIWPKVKSVLDTNIFSFKKVDASEAIKSMHSVQQTKPHVITKRAGELVCVLAVLGSPSFGSEADRILIMGMSQMQALITAKLQSMGKEFINVKDRQVFLINNYDLLLSLLVDHQLAETDITQRFEKLRREEVDAYVEAQLLQYFSELVKFVKETEVAINAAPESVHAVIDVARMERLVRKFSSEWKSNLKSMHGAVIASFANFDNGVNVLKQALTQLLLYHTRFQKLIALCFPSQPQPGWLKEVVLSSVILDEIRAHSRGF